MNAIDSRFDVFSTEKCPSFVMNIWVQFSSISVQFRNLVLKTERHWCETRQHLVLCRFGMGRDLGRRTAKARRQFCHED